MEDKIVYLSTNEQVAAYHTASVWACSEEPIKARLGREACTKLHAGEDPAKVLEDMRNEYAAFQVAQEG